MPICSSCPCATAMRHGHDRAGRQRFLCLGCRRTFTADSAAAFAGYHWPADVILMAVRWSLTHPLSGSSVMVLLAERGIDVSPRTVLRWVQHFGPLLAAEIRKHRRRPGSTWYVDEVFFFRRKGEEKRYLYRAIDEHGQVLDVLFRDHRDTASAEAFFRRARTTSGVSPTTVVTDHHQPYIAAVQAVLPAARHIRTGLHRARGETTKPIERSHVATRDRLRSSRGLKPVATGQRVLAWFEGLQAVRRGHIKLRALVPRYQPTKASLHETTRAVMVALSVLGAQLKKAA